MASAGNKMEQVPPTRDASLGEPKTVLLVSNKVFHYRVANYNYFAARFQEMGFRFVVRANETQHNNPYPPEFDYQEVPFSFWKYKRAIEELKPVVVILFLYLKDPFTWLLLHWLKLKRIPVVYWNKGINLEVIDQSWRNQLFYYVHSVSDAIILYSARNIRDIQPKNRSKVFVASNTINLDALPVVSASKEEIKREFGIPFEKVVLFVGRMREVKKVEHLIEVFNSIHDPAFGCVIVGQAMGYDLPSMIQGSNVLYLGEVFDSLNEKVSKLFKASDLFCIPGDVGLGLNEAFHWGLPVVTEDGLQPPEIHYLTQGRNGFVVPENNVEELRKKVLLLLENDGLRAEFSRAAKEDIARDASIEKMFSGFRDCVLSLTAGEVEQTRGAGDGGVSKSHPSSPVQRVLSSYTGWLERYGPYSQDHQDFFASAVGRAAKALYYRSKALGTLAVLPMVFCEAFLPGTRRFFLRPMRLPISDAHFAMGYALLFRSSGRSEHYEKAVEYLEALKESRCPGYTHAGWGYPFDWQTRRGLIKAGTPLITTTPYCYEAFEYVYRIDGRPEWREILHSIAEHAFVDYRDFPAGPEAMTCTYTPEDGQGVVNASSYRGALLTLAWQEFGEAKYLEAAERNINFVLQSQQADGSWPYAMDGTRDFVDHFHTCFVMKGLAKFEKLTGNVACGKALERGVRYYLDNLFDDHGLPKPFSKAPRLTVYKRELYDCAECLNLGTLLAGRFPELDQVVERVTTDIVTHWQQRSGSFRSRKLLLGYDNVPMHRWGGSEMFRSFSLLAARAAGYDVFAKSSPKITCAA